MHPRFLLALVLAGSVSAAETAPDPVARFHTRADQALQAMQAKAASVRIRGAAVIACVPGERTRSWVSRMEAVGDFIIDRKSNVLAIAYTKMAEMADTLQPSGAKVRDKYIGENAFQGGLIAPVPGGYMLVAFSGGYDLQVAKAGLDVLTGPDEEDTPVPTGP
jgi:hypothetical protein